MKNNKAINQGWKTVSFSECLEKVSFGREKQIKSKDYEKAGEFPIVDQGQSFIAGYTDDRSKVIDSIQPYIIFGDHTRILKYIDFPIALGADGTKIIKPKKDFNTKFFYYYLRHLDIPSRGYNRHYSLLKEKTIAKPGLSEQKAIAKVLNTAQDAISGQEKLIEKLKQLKKTMMHHLFTHGTKKEPTKMTEIGEIPESWEVKKLGEMCELKYGKNLPANSRKAGRFPVYGSNGIVGSHLQPTVNAQGIIIGRKGSVGNVHFSHTPFCPIDTTFYLTQNDTKENLRFLYYLLLGLDLTKLKADVGVPGLNRQMAYSELVRITRNKQEQQKIADALDDMEAKIESAQAKLSVYHKLFRTLLHELMSRERQIKC